MLKVLDYVVLELILECSSLSDAYAGMGYDILVRGCVFLSFDELQLALVISVYKIREAGFEKQKQDII